MTDDLIWTEIERLSQEVLLFHQNQLLKTGRRLIPHLTDDDLLQPNDYPALESNPHFRYDEGVVCGIQTIQMALLALRKKLEKL